MDKDEDHKSQLAHAASLTEAIIQKLLHRMRTNMGFWPKEADIVDLKREIKSIIIQDKMK